MESLEENKSGRRILRYGKLQVLGTFFKREITEMQRKIRVVRCIFLLKAEKSRHIKID